MGISERELIIKFEKIKTLAKKANIELLLKKYDRSFCVWLEYPEEYDRLLFIGSRFGTWKYLDGIETGLNFAFKKEV